MMHDEGVSHYTDQLLQLQLGHQWLHRNFQRTQYAVRILNISLVIYVDFQRYARVCVADRSVWSQQHNAASVFARRLQSDCSQPYSLSTERGAKAIEAL